MLQQEQELDIDKRIREARVVPDIAGRDGIGSAAVFLANGQPQLPIKDRADYFVRSVV